MEKPKRAGVLIRTMKEWDSVAIGDLGVITITLIKGNTVRVGFHFPDPGLEIRPLKKKDKH